MNSIPIAILWILFRNQAKILRPEDLPKGCIEHLRKWKEDGTVTSIVPNLTQGQVMKLAEVIAKLFGEVTLTRATGERVKLWRVGMQTETSGEIDGKHLSTVILYRRDLAADRKLRKPWKAVHRERYLVQPLVEIPQWM